MQTWAIEDIEARLGEEIGRSNWMLVDQARIDRFAEVTEDNQWIHVEPIRAAAETPFGGSIAHGFLILSLLAPMAADVLPDIRGSVMGINYGLDRVRFIQPVPAGSRVRGVFRLADCEYKAYQQRLKIEYEVNIYIEGSDKPAMVANWISLIQLADSQ